MFSPHITHRLAAAGTSFVLIASVATGFTMINSNKTEPQVKGVATTKVATAQTKQQDKPAPAVKPAGETTDAPAAAAKPAQNGSLAAKKPIQASTTASAAPTKETPATPGASTPAKPDAQAPAPTPAPAPVPSFHFVFHHDQAFESTSGLPGGAATTSRIIPFEVVYDTGFVGDPNVGSWPGCDILTAASGLTCTIGAKDSWLLVMGYTDATPNGQYSVSVSYRYDTTVKSATTSFTLNR